VEQADGGTRTPDPIITSDVLYQLSYVGKRSGMVATVASGAEPRVPGMDAHLKRLAEAGLALTEAEDAAGAGELGQAADALDRADAVLEGLRGQWAAMSGPERAVVGPAARDLRDRLDRTRARLPRRTALSVGAPERDPDEEIDPAPAA
jgi:hypothetical protein